MAHTLKKYLSNRGSALFMVLSTMTALMVCCMAMYFSVISSRSTQYAVFNQQQSYQSAVSLSDAVISGMISGDSKFETFTNKIWNLNDGETYTTSSNGFATFDSAGAGNVDDENTGAYMLAATKLPDETLADGTVVKVYDIAITASVNGVKEVYHSILQIQQASAETPPGVSSVFTATGYVPNDVFLDGGVFLTDVFFDNQHTIINAYGGKTLQLDGDLSCGGSLTNNNYILIKATRPVTFAIRDTYTATANQVITYAEPTGGTTVEKNKTRSTVMIGGDCHLSNEAGFKNANVYVLGDLYLNNTTLHGESRYFVDGDVIVEDSRTYAMNYVYVNGTVKNCSNMPAGNWTGFAKGKATDGLLTVSEMIDLLEEKTATGIYYKWKVDTSNFMSGEQTLTFNTDKDNPKPTAYLKYTDSTRGCVLKDLTLNHPNNGGPNSIAVVIDTGENPENVFTIKLQGNRDYRGDSEKETFCWYPKNITPGGWANGQTTWAGNGSNVPLTIIVKGRGSVVIDIPEGVTYQDDDHLKVMHYGWFVLNGGQEIYHGGTKDGKTQKEIEELTEYKRKGDSGTDDVFFAQFIHRGCHTGDGCSYSKVTTTKDCSICGAKMKSIDCSVHGTVDTYCDNCQPNRFNREAKCENRIGKTEIDTFLASHPTMKSKMTGSDGNLIYPNVNIFLVSCDENADIRLSSRAAVNAEDPAQVFIQNGFFGYVYAPYLTFKAGPSNSGGGMVRFLGGLTVSDYIIDDSYSFLACYPDKMPEELMGSDSKPIYGTASKSWKIALKAH